MENQSEGKKHLVCIGGYGRSGSTILDINLARQYNGISLGEIRYTKTHTDQKSRSCSCSHSYDKCPFWSKILQSETISADSTLQYFSIATSLRLLVRGELHARIIEFYDELFRHSSHCTIVIDSSKTGPGAFLRPYLLLRVLKGRYNVHLVGLYRHPVGVYQSLLKGSNEQMITGKTLSVEGKKFGLKNAFTKVIFSWSYANIALLLNHFLFRVHGESSQIHAIEKLSDRLEHVELPGVSRVHSLHQQDEALFHMMGGNRLSGSQESQKTALSRSKVSERHGGFVNSALVLIVSPVLLLLKLFRK